MQLHPSLLYYLALYFLILVVRFFKLRRAQEGAWTLSSWKKVFYVGLEVVYTASGLVTSLLTDERAYTEAIIIVYLIFVMIASQIESIEGKISENAVFLANFLILAVATGTTVWYYQSVKLAQKEQEAAIAKESAAKRPIDSFYRVAVPYNDKVLEETAGAGFFIRKQFVFLKDVVATDRDDAKQKALAAFKGSVQPFKARKKKINDENERGDQVVIDEEHIVIELAK